MSKDVLDRRVQKTRQLLKDALVVLISEKGFESVTIQEILDRANVGRSTFYLHFENKNELLHSCFEDFFNLFEQYKAGVSNGKKHGDLNETDFTLKLFQFVERNHRLFKALLGKDVIAMFNRLVHDYVFIYIDEALKKMAKDKKQTPLQLEMLTHYIASAFIGILKWWVDKDMPCTVEEVDKYFKQFAMYDISKVLGLRTPSFQSIIGE